MEDHMPQFLGGGYGVKYYSLCRRRVRVGEGEGRINWH